MRRLALAVTATALVGLCFSTVADARTYRIRPSAQHGDVYVFSLRALHAKSRGLASAELRVDSAARPIGLTRMRRAIHRGRIALHAPGRRGRARRSAVLLVLVVDARAPAAGAPRGWTQVFRDDFATDVPLGSFPAAVASTWSAYPDGWRDTSGNGTYFPSKVVSVHDGLMDLHLHTEGSQHLVAAPVPKLPGTAKPYGQRYGRYEVRFKADALPGYKTAWLLWPDSGVWPRDGEIDFPEGDLDAGICGYVHHMDATRPSDQDRFCPRAPYDAWHTAVIEWTPGAVRFELDGQPVGTSTTRVPSTPMHWVIQTETALDGTVPAAATDGHVLIDWVAVYRPA